MPASKAVGNVIMAVPLVERAVERRRTAVTRMHRASSHPMQRQPQTYQHGLTTSLPLAVHLQPLIYHLQRSWT